MGLAGLMGWFARRMGFEGFARFVGWRLLWLL
jgi:hypothetical protein